MAPRPHRDRVLDYAQAVRAAIIGMPVKTLEVDTIAGKITVQMFESANGAGCNTEQGADEWQERMKKLGLDP